MKKALQRVIPFLLLGSLVSGQLFSCGTTASPAVTDAPAPTGDSEETAVSLDSLPNKDYKGDNFNILLRTEWAYEFDVEEENGDVVNDAIFKRNQTVEERFNINLNCINVDGNWSNRMVFDNVLNSSILAGEDSYDFVAGYQATMITPAMNGLFLNVYDVPCIDTSKPWWSEKANDSLTIGGCMYMITGDIVLTMWENLYCFYFNKHLAAEYNIPDLYETVRNGEWTLDKLIELSSSVSDDLNGDTVYDENDLYGFYSCTGSPEREFMVSCDLPITKLNADGYHELCFNTPRTIEAVEKLYRLLNQAGTLRKANLPSSVFDDNHALTMMGTLKSSADMRDLDTDFGILPYPKFDAAQKEYRTTLSNTVSMICYPVTIRDPEMSGLITEALGMYSYELVTPEYYETALKGKYSRDNQSAEMIDLIRSSLTFDFGWVHSMEMNTIGAMFDKVLPTGNFSSYYAENESSYVTGLERINEAYRKANES